MVLPIILATDDNYAPYCGVTIQSIIEHASLDNMYYIHILHTSLSNSFQEQLEGMSGRNIKITCFNVTQEMNDKIIVSTNHLSPETTYRILIPRLFPQYEKVLYLDSDLVVLKDVADLFIFDIESYALGAAEYVSSSFDEEHQNRIGVPLENAFNAGVLLINCKKFKELGIEQKCFDLLEDTEDLPFLDQDALNLTCTEHVKFFNASWNCTWHFNFPCYAPVAEHTSRFEQSFATPHIVHYTSAIKPWANPKYELAKHFWHYAEKSPFYDYIFTNAVTTDHNFKIYFFPFESIPYGKRIVVYGGGIVGQTYHTQLTTTGLYNVVAWVDQKYELLQGIGNITHPTSLINLEYDMIIVAVEREYTATHIINYLNELGVESQKIFWAPPQLSKRRTGD